MKNKIHYSNKVRKIPKDEKKEKKDEIEDVSDEPPQKGYFEEETEPEVKIGIENSDSVCVGLVSASGCYNTVGEKCLDPPKVDPIEEVWKKLDPVLQPELDNYAALAGVMYEAIKQHMENKKKIDPLNKVWSNKEEDEAWKDL